MPFGRFSFSRQKTLPYLIGLALLPQVVYAFSPFVIKDIQVNGLENTSPEMIYSFIPIRPGTTFNEHESSEVISRLFRTGIFQDVSVATKGHVVILNVVERPLISALTFKGQHAFKAEELTKALASFGLAVGTPLNPSLLNRAIIQLKQEYQNKGRSGVKVEVVQTPLPNNRVGLNFIISEGVSTRINNINIVGNKAYSKSKLLDLMVSSPTGWFTWYSGRDKYNPETLSKDIETIRQYYLDHGYAQVQILPPQISITPNREDVGILLTINEGDQFKVNTIHLTGQLLGLNDELSKLVTVQPHSIYDASAIQAVIDKVSAQLSQYGYALNKVTPQLKFNDTDHTVDIHLDVQPGRRVYVHQVNIGGNTRTRDRVIRREVRQLESAWYNSNQVELSKARLNRLGYFSQVKVTRQPVPGSLDQIDLNVDVTEKPLGLINFGVGYGSSDGLTFQGSISQDNIFGSGTNLSAQFNTSRTGRVFSLTHYDPYFTYSGISRSTSLYYRTSRPYAQSGNADAGKYSTKTTGLTLNFGIPLSETMNFYTGFTVDHTHVVLPKSGVVTQAYRNFIGQYGARNNSLVWNLGWAYDTRDSFLTPTSGYYTSLNLDTGVYGIKYYMFTANAQWYIPLATGYTLAFNGAFNYGHTLDNKKLYPVIKNVYLGGIGSVRGYGGGSLGPRDVSTGDYIGGQNSLVGNVQLFLPFPGNQHDQNVRWFLFTDAGRLKTTGQTECTRGPAAVQDPCGWRYSAGVGLSWISPIGPLQISWAKPLHPKPTDNIERFQFQIGSSF